MLLDFPPVPHRPAGTSPAVPRMKRFRLSLFGRLRPILSGFRRRRFRLGLVKDSDVEVSNLNLRHRFLNASSNRG